MKISFLKNSFHNTMSGVIRMGLMLLLTPILLRLVGVNEYGIWALSNAIVDLIALSGNGIATTTMIFTSKAVGNNNSKELSKILSILFISVIIIATLTGIVIFLNSELIVSLFPQLELSQKIVVKNSIQIGIVIIWTRLLQQVLIGIEQAYYRYEILNKLNTLQWTLLSLGLALIASWGGKTYTLMKWQTVVFMIILIGHLWEVQKILSTVELEIIWDIKKAYEIGKSSLVNWLICFANVAFGRSDRLIVGSLLGIEAIGVYTVISEITSGVNSLALLPVQPIVPLLSNHFSEKRIDNLILESKIKQTFEVNALVALTISTILFIFAPLIMQILSTNIANVQNVSLLRYAIIIYAFFSLNSPGFCILLSVAEKRAMIYIWVSVVLTLLLIIISSINFGLIGSVVGNIGFTLTLLMNFEGMKKLNISPFLWLKYILFPIICFLTCIILSWQSRNNIILDIVLAIASIFALVNWFLYNQKLRIRNEKVNAS